MKTDLSIIIVMFNSAGFIVPCLTALELATRAYTTQVIVVDCGSTDQGSALVQESFDSVELVRQDNIGFSAGNNVALPLCRGEKILLLNPDTAVSEESIARLMHALDTHAEVGAVGPCLRSVDGSIQEHSAHNLPTLRNMLSWLFLLDKVEWHLRFRGRQAPGQACLQGTWFDGFSLLRWQRSHSAEVPYLSGACLMLRRSVVRQVGYLDVSAPLYLDDIDYCRRIQDEGWKLLYVAEASILHHGQQSSASHQRDAIFYALLCNSIYLYLKKHHGKLTALAYRVGAVVAGVLRLCTSAFVGKVVWGRAGAELQRQRQMSAALLRWAIGSTSDLRELKFAAVPLFPVWSSVVWKD